MYMYYMYNVNYMYNVYMYNVCLPYLEQLVIALCETKGKKKYKNTNI